MKISHTAIAIAAALLAGTAARATLLTFDNFDAHYGDGAPVGAKMTDNGQDITYTEDGYILTFHTLNIVSPGHGAHIGDAYEDYTFNWHDGGTNLSGSYLTIARANGGLFDLTSFDFVIVGDGSTVSAGSYTSFDIPGYTLGTATVDFNGVSSVSFSTSVDGFNQFDNILLSAIAVPEPATWAMMLVGFGMVGAAVRRGQKVAVSFG